MDCESGFRAALSVPPNLGYDPAAFRGLAGARAEGGPVSGGSTYMVNELGREGFLSSSGRLSEINVPAFGSWKAPTSGEVIPADVWAEMKAGQGIQTTSTPWGAAPSRVASHTTSVSNVTNNNQAQITVQAMNPVQAASELMVANAKRRRARFR